MLDTSHFHYTILLMLQRASEKDINDLRMALLSQIRTDVLTILYMIMLRVGIGENNMSGARIARRHINAPTPHLKH